MREKSWAIALAVTVGIASCSKKSSIEDVLFRGRDQRALLAEATELTVFAIGRGGDAPRDELHGYPIRRTVRIPADQVAAVAQDVALGLGRGIAANCFEPHHALRVTSRGQTIDLVICFSCSSVSVFRGEEQVEAMIPINDRAEAVLARFVGPAPDEDERW